MDYVKAFLAGGLFWAYCWELWAFTNILRTLGAGATVPLTGFGYNLAKGVREAVDQDGFIGIFTGGLKACAGGIAAAVFSGLLVSFIFRPRDKS